MRVCPILIVVGQGHNPDEYQHLKSRKRNKNTQGDMNSLIYKRRTGEGGW